MEPRHISPWSTSAKIKRVFWALVQNTVFRYSPRPCYAWRAFLLRLFGAKLGKCVRVHPTVKIEIPWHLTIGNDTAIGDSAILYCLGPVTIGKFVTISQYAHICAGSHDTTNREFTLLRPPITLGDDVWIATDAYVGPNVTIGDRTILGARSSAFSSLPADVVAVGSPAKPIRPRVFNP